MHEIANTVDGALAGVAFDKLCPGQDKLQQLQERFR